MSLQQFMNAIGSVESGNNYDAVGPYTGATYGRARGRYQVMEKIWPGWAREAGVDPNDMSSEAQDRVAAHKMQQYFNRYGSWELVAVAWFAGPGRADRAAREGVTSLKGIADVLGTDVPGYVSKVMKAMGSAPDRLTPAGGGDGTLGAPEQDGGDDFQQQRQDASSLLAGIMASVSQAASQAGGKVLDVKALFGEPPTPEDATSLSLDAQPADPLPPAPGEDQEAV